VTRLRVQEETIKRQKVKMIELVRALEMKDGGRAQSTQEMIELKQQQSQLEPASSKQHQ